jgi:hypothetical protein
LQGKIDARTQQGKGTIGAKVSVGASIFGSALEFVSIGGGVETASSEKNEEVKKAALEILARQGRAFAE